MHNKWKMKMNNLSFSLHFLFAAYPELMSKVLEIATRTQSTHFAHQAGLRKKETHTGAATVIQRFGSALNMNIHLTCIPVQQMAAGRAMA